MADNDPGTPPRAYQPIEPIDDPQTDPAPPAAAAGQAPSPAPPQPQPQPAQPPQEVRATAPPVPVAARFGSAAATLIFAGQLLSISQAASLTFGAEGDHAYWVLTELDLDIARELVEVAHGTTFVRAASGRLIEDHGWGDPPAEAMNAAGQARSVDPGVITPVSLARLVRVSGLHAAAERPAEEVRVLLPGSLMANVVRRALDLEVSAAHRPVRLRPLFTDNGGPAVTSLIELRLSVPDGRVPPSLLTALARQAQLCVCRVAGDDENLLIEYGKAGPLLDHLLAGLIGDQSWLLSSGRIGCQLVEPAGEFTDSAACVRLADDYPLQSPAGVSDDRPQLPELQLVSGRTPGRNVDAVLLTSADLDSVGLLLEGHPLSESAQLVRGRDHHLLLAAGGLGERLPLGEPLYCLGPGPFYLPLGTVTRPRLPASARHALFRADAETGVVLLADVLLKFQLKNRKPVWTLWVGQPPEIDLQLPAETLTVLDELGSETSSRPDQQPQPQTAPGNVRTWLDDALDAEFRGELALAAELHERHGDPMRAARLFARAAEKEAGAGATGGS